MSNQLTTQQSGWLRLAEIKTTLFNDLQAAELAVQGIINGMGADLPSVQEAIKEAKGTMAEAKGKRLAFSRMIDDKLLTPAMAYEKRMAEVIEQAGATELELRKQAEKEAQAGQALQNEIAAYRAHITNEWYRIAAEYRTELHGLVTHCYVTLLKNKMNPQHLGEAIDNLERVLRDVKVPKPAKFNRTLIDNETARDIVASVQPFDAAWELENIISELPERFKMYAHDLENAEAAAAAIAKKAEEQAAETAQKLAVEQATNVLIAEAETVIIDAPKVKRELKIVPVESEQWATTIVANFLKNWQYCNKFVRVKSWQKLTIGQMADALAKHISETGETITGIQTEEICK